MPRGVPRGGRPPKHGEALSVADSFTEFRTWFDWLDERLTRTIQGRVDLAEFRDDLDAAFGGFETWEELDQGRSAGKTPHEQVIAIAAALQRMSIIREVFLSYGGRLDRITDSLEAALIAADVGRRVVDSYMAEFSARLQAEGVLKNHVRDMPKAKLRQVVELLKGSDLSGDAVPPAEGDTGPSLTSRSHWDVIDTSRLPYDLVERDAVTEVERSALGVQLPEVTSPGELGDFSTGLMKLMLENIEQYADAEMFTNRLLPDWEKRTGQTLSNGERRAWAFLLVIVRYPEEVARYRQDDRSFAGLLFPGRSSSTVREVRIRS